MAPTRHETSGAGSPESPETSTSYGTRSSKRKVSEISANGAPELSPSRKRTSPKKSNDDEAEQPAAKKRRSEATSSPAETNGDEENLASETPATWDEVQVAEANGEETPESTSALPVSSRGRGRGGWRGKRGRGGVKTKAKVAPKKIVAAPKGRGRGRGGRRKASVNPRIDALNVRAAELKSQYSALARLQKNALELLSEKSLKMVKEDPTYHESLPEYDEVTAALDQLLEKRLRVIQNEEMFRTDLQQRTLEYNKHMAHDNHCEVIADDVEARIEEYGMYVWQQGMIGKPLEEVPVNEVNEGQVATIHVKKTLHSLSTPYTKAQDAVPTASTLGDTEYEQHPANYWRALNSKQKKEALKERDFLMRKKISDATDPKKTNKRKREALFQPVQAHVTMEDEEDQDEEEEPEEPSGADTPATHAPTHKKLFGQGAPAVVPTDDYYDSSDAEEYAEDAHGVSVPRKKRRHNAVKPVNNRIMVPPSFQFEDWEIGQRQHYFKKASEKDLSGNMQTSFAYLGMDRTANREHVFLDQRANACNSANLKPEDFDQRIVETHHLHPKFGVPIPGSTNPDHDEVDEPYFEARTKKPGDLPLPASKRVLEIYDGGSRRKMFHSSRNWGQEVEASGADHSGRVKMFRLLRAAGDDEHRLLPAATEKQMKQHDETLNAANYIYVLEKKKTEEERAAAKALADAAAKFAARQPVAPPQMSSSRYDPVRDTTYQTPYPRTVPPPPPPPAQFGVYQQGGPLSALADMADFGKHPLRFPPPPPPPPPPAPWAGPMAGPSMSGLQPNSFFITAPPPPPPLPSFQSPRANQGNLRPLQPAPPRGGRRTTPPQPSSRSWYPGQQ
ncbi:hypothetical protein EG329_011713 [Mollisiaceae sp. DMI_Dod_QoI]|nr:hypothetical protein EG329_011713 [Helotiales sp. DMI_Dod_QoI]